MPPVSLATAQPVDLNAYEKQEPVTVIGQGAMRLIFSTPNQITHWRVETLFTKEPDTIEWIEGFAPEDTLVDIGANVGMYTIYAARMRRVRVFAFEPEAQNFATLNRNIYLNQLSELVTAYPVALADEEKFDQLFLAQFMAGGSCHNFASPTDGHEQPMQPVFVQGCFATTLDLLVQRQAIPVPTHIKIDVDGIEPKVVGGMMTTLAQPALRSVLVEINSGLASHQAIMEHMRSIGFGWSEAQVNQARRTEGGFKGVGNVIFQR